MIKNTIIAALIAAMPVLAQDTPQPRHWGAGGMMPGREMSEEDRAAMREEMQRRMMERFDTDKDGQISAEERAAAHAEMNNRRPQGPEGNVHPGNRRRPHSERPEMIQRFDTDGDGQLSAEEHEALRAAAQNRRGERGQRGPRRRQRPEGQRPMPAPPAADTPTTLEL